MIRGLLFDKDGTLFEFRRSWAGWANGLLTEISTDQAHARRMGQAIGYDVDQQTFSPMSPVIASTASVIADLLAPHLPHLSLDQIEDQINGAASKASMVPAVPLVPLLEELRRRGLRIGLATNDTERPARSHLAAHDLTHLFDFVAGYDSGHGAKPGPGMCLAFAKATDLAPHQIAMIGDSLHDLEAGRAAGMVRVGVLTGMATESDLKPHADVVLSDIGALPNWLDHRAQHG